jgi:hypothetical protein
MVEWDTDGPVEYVDCPAMGHVQEDACAFGQAHRSPALHLPCDACPARDTVEPERVEFQRDVTRYGSLVGNPMRTAAETDEMGSILDRLRRTGRDPGWTSAEQVSRPIWPGRSGR